MLIDTHCHLDPSYYPDGHAAALERARAAGVGGFVAIGVGDSLAPARHVRAIADAERDVWFTAGVHPHDAKTLLAKGADSVGAGQARFDDAALLELAELARHPRCVALGEIGLDYHYMHSETPAQLAVFRRLVALAKEIARPIVVHTREAAADTLAVLEQEGARDVGGIIHCFSEDKAFATRALDLGFDLSFSGIVTFKSATSVHEVAAWAPADRILVETDSPYLAPIPFRGKPCEPAMVTHTARRVAELRGVAFEELCERTTENARRRLALSAPQSVPVAG